MINMPPVVEYFSIALHFMTCTLLLCGLLVWTQRQENRRQRTYLAVTAVISGLLMLLRLLVTYKQGVPMAYPVMPVPNMYGGFLALLLFFLYPVEVVHPGWLKGRRVFLFFLPVIVITLVLVLVPMEFRQLHSLTDMLSHIEEPNVWGRLVALVIFNAPYIFLLLCVPYDWRQSSVDAKWIRIYLIGGQGIGVLYILSVLTGSVAVSAIHMTYCTLLFAYITYQELFLRLFPAAAQTELLPKPMTKEEGMAQQIASGLWRKLEIYMQQEEPWRSPNITIGDVAKAIGCSRSTLSAEISSQKIGSFYSLVAQYRIAAFCEMARKNEITNVNEALFAVGFRSRSTAYERFKEQQGMTPAEYIKTLK